MVPANFTPDVSRSRNQAVGPPRYVTCTITSLVEAIYHIGAWVTQDVQILLGLSRERSGPKEVVPCPSDSHSVSDTLLLLCRLIGLLRSQVPLCVLCFTAHQNRVRLRPVLTFWCVYPMTLYRVSVLLTRMSPVHRTGSQVSLSDLGLT